MEEEKKEQNVGTDDDFVIGKGFAIEEPVEEEPKPEKKKKQGKGIARSLIRIFLILIISGGLAFGILYAGMDYMGITFGGGKDIPVYIEEGTSVQRIAKQLKEEGVIKIPVLFRLYVKVKHYEDRFQWGLHTFNTEDGYAEVATVLSEEAMQAKQAKVTIPEGVNIDEIAKRFEEAGVCKAEDFIDEIQHGKFNYDFIKQIPEQKVYYRLEGYLFPETLQYYCYDPEADSDSAEFAHLAVDRLLEEFNRKVNDDIRKEVEKSGYSLHEILTLASIVEMEAGGDASEMANVAAVFWNRIKSDEFSKLESSPTQKYPYGSGKYDTYQSEGLPPGPLCSPSLAAIKATLNPTPDFAYYYFVTDAKMKFYYNKTLAEHNNTINRLIKENNWIGDQ